MTLRHISRSAACCGTLALILGCSSDDGSGDTAAAEATPPAAPGSNTMSEAPETAAGMPGVEPGMPANPVVQPPAAMPEPPAAMPEPPAAMPGAPAAMPEPPAALPEPPAVMPEPPAAMPEPPAAMPEPPAPPAANLPPPELDANGCPMPQLVGWATTGDGTTGGGDTAPVEVSSAGEMKDALSGNDPRVVVFSGSIDTGGSSIQIGSNKTLRGSNKDATIVGGLSVGGNNVIVQNLTVQGKGEGNRPADAVNGSGSNIWFDHLNITEGGDGILDLVNGADRITTSWNKFWYTDSGHSHRLALLFSNSSNKCSEDGGRQRHTIHHNWFSDLVDQRMPRLYYGIAHIYNNFYNSPGNSYCIGVGTWATVLIENNYFKDVSDPHRRQNDYPTYIEAVGNIYDNTTGKQEDGATGIGTIPDRFAGSECHANLADPGPWTPPYPVSPDPAESIPELVQRCAGPQ